MVYFKAILQTCCHFCIAQQFLYKSIFIFIYLSQFEVCYWFKAGIFYSQSDGDLTKTPIYAYTVYTDSLLSLGAAVL